jgi:hypothetical protein
LWTGAGFADGDGRTLGISFAGAGETIVGRELRTGVGDSAGTRTVVADAAGTMGIAGGGAAISWDAERAVCEMNAFESVIGMTEPRIGSGCDSEVPASSNSGTVGFESGFLKNKFSCGIEAFANSVSGFEISGSGISGSALGSISGAKWTLFISLPEGVAFRDRNSCAYSDGLLKLFATEAGTMRVGRFAAGARSTAAGALWAAGSVAITIETCEPSNASATDSAPTEGRRIGGFPRMDFALFVSLPEGFAMDARGFGPSSSAVPVLASGAATVARADLAPRNWSSGDSAP